MSKVIKQLIAYKYMTIGGVEKCILNRACLHKKYNLPIKIYAYFLHHSKNVEEKILAYIRKYQLETHIECIHSLTDYSFDVINLIDTPELFDRFSEINVECHSSYKENITYLKNLGKNTRKIIVPTDVIKKVVCSEYNFSNDAVTVLTNFVIKPELELVTNKIFWNKIPLFYFGRLDNLKNPQELFEIFKACQDISNQFMFIVVSNSLVELRSLLKKFPKIVGSLVLLPSIDFTKIPEFLALMKAHKGIFISASRQETFGFSAAETLMSGIPTVLSDNYGHRLVTNQNESFLYQLGDIEEAREKILKIKSEYNDLYLDMEHILRLERDYIEQLKSIINF